MCFVLVKVVIALQIFDNTHTHTQNIGMVAITLLRLYQVNAILFIVQRQA